MRRLSRSDSNKRGTTFGHVAITLGATLLLGLATTIPVAHAGKPVPPPPVPSVYYDLWDLGEGSPHAMNDAGMMVGHSLINLHAYKFDWLTGRGDLNDSANWIDLNNNSSTTGWTAVDATGINNSGEIVGVAQHATTLAIRAYHFQGTTFKLLPGPTFADVRTPKIKINEVGTICAADGDVNVIVYSPSADLTTYSYTYVATPIVAADVDINNFGVIVATNNTMDPTSVRIVLGVGGYTLFPHCALRRMSDSFICGVRAASGNVKGAPIRVGIDQSPSQVLALTSTNSPYSTWAGGVNNDGDVVISQSLVLYKDGVSLKISDLIAPNSRTSWTALNNSQLPIGISDRSTTVGFGLISFMVNTASPRAILLIPWKP